MPQCRGIGKNELLIPSKSPPFPIWGVVGTDIDRCISGKVRGYYATNPRIIVSFPVHSHIFTRLPQGRYKYDDKHMHLTPVKSLLE